MADREDQRREAEAEAGIPPRGFKDTALRLWTQIDDDHVMLVAAGVAFYSLLALFPLLTAMVSIYGLIADRGDIEQHLAKLYGMLPSDAIEIMRQQLVSLNKTEAPKLGLLFVGSLLFSLWSANKAVTSIFEAMNIAYGERERRGFFRFTATTLFFTCGFVVFIVLSLVAIVAMPPLLESLGFDEDTHWLLSLSRWPILLFIVVTMNSIVYRYGPSRENPRWVWITWGSVAAAVLWLIMSAGFSFYAANFARFNETYGSMGAVIAVMTWIWLSAIIVIAGAELNAELEYQPPLPRSDTPPAADNPDEEGMRLRKSARPRDGGSWTGRLLTRALLALLRRRGFTAEDDAARRHR